MENLYRLNNDDLSRAGEGLLDAFQDDPVFNAIFEGATPEQQVAFYTMVVRYCMKYGRVFAPSPHLEGVAAWVPDEFADMSFMRLLLSGAFWTGLKMGMDYSQKMATVFKPIDQDRKEHMQGRDYIYLVMIGIAPQYQGQGLGGKLFTALFEESEQSGLPVYLETETDENVKLYEHLGFQVIKKATLPIIDLPMWEMIREPKG